MNLCNIIMTIQSMETKKVFWCKSHVCVNLFCAIAAIIRYWVRCRNHLRFMFAAGYQDRTRCFPDTSHPISRKSVQLPLGTFQVAPIKTVLSEKLHFRRFEVGNYRASKARQIILVCFLSHEPLLLARIATLRRHYDVIVTCARVCALSLMVQLQTITGVVKTNACKLRR